MVSTLRLLIPVKMLSFEMRRQPVTTAKNKSGLVLNASPKKPRRKATIWS